MVSWIQKEVKYDRSRTAKMVHGILQDVSRCIDNYHSSGSDLSFRGHVDRVDKLAIEFLRHSTGQFLRRRTTSSLLLDVEHSKRSLRTS